MPRGKAPFSLQKRDGRKYRYVYYVQFRDQQGNYTSAISTGESSEGAARAWAMEYLRQGNVPTHRGNTFAKFAANWWVPGECLYLKEQEASGYKKSPRYIAESRRNLKNRLLLYFGPRKLTSIQPLFRRYSLTTIRIPAETEIPRSWKKHLSRVQSASDMRILRTLRGPSDGVELPATEAWSPSFNTIREQEELSPSGRASMR